MTDIRKRLNSSMTYEEYVSTFDKAPRKPSLKPLQDPQIELEELDLQEETQQQIVQKEKSLTIIYEEDEENRTPNKIVRLPQHQNQQQPHRPRAQSENIQYTFISFMEKGIERKQSKKFE